MTKSKVKPLIILRHIEEEKALAGVLQRALESEFLSRTTRSTARGPRSAASTGR